MAGPVGITGNSFQDAEKNLATHRGLKPSWTRRSKDRQVFTRGDLGTRGSRISSPTRSGLISAMLFLSMEPESQAMEELEQAVTARLDTVDPETDDRDPIRVFTFYKDRVPAPALYMEVVVDNRDVSVIAHNLRYYEYAMRRWHTGFLEAIILNELHEVTHWAMTDDERDALDERSREYALPDGYWLNGTLLELIDWMDGGDTAVLDGGFIGWRHVHRRLAWSVRRALPFLDPR